MAEQPTKTSSGVQELINRIRDQGVRSGQEEADRILADAKEQAARMIAAAEAEIEARQSKAQARLEADEASSIASLEIAARDSALELQSAVVVAFERQVKRLVSNITQDGSFLKALVLVLGGHAADEYIGDKDIQVFASQFAFDEESGPEVEERVREATLAIGSDMLREGIELVPSEDIDGGVRVRVVEDNLEIDLSSEAISKLLLRHMLPRFRALLSGAE